MNLVLHFNQYRNEYIFFSDSIKNTVIENSNFIRIYYSTNLFTLNGIFLLVPFTSIRVEGHFNKFKYIFNPEENKELIQTISFLEEEILNKINIDDKIAKYNICNQLQCGFIKIINEKYTSNIHNFILKISGIWETNKEYGLTFKFVEVTHR
jgi:hypothetical protein